MTTILGTLLAFAGVFGLVYCNAGPTGIATGTWKQGDMVPEWENHE